MFEATETSSLVLSFQL